MYYNKLGILLFSHFFDFSIQNTKSSKTIYLRCIYAREKKNIHGNCSWKRNVKCTRKIQKYVNEIPWFLYSGNEIFGYFWQHLKKCVRRKKLWFCVSQGLSRFQLKISLKKANTLCCRCHDFRKFAKLMCEKSFQCSTDPKKLFQSIILQAVHSANMKFPMKPSQNHYS